MPASVQKTQTSRERRRTRTRERVYQSALDEFRRTGITAAQISDIAREAGVAYGTFYTHFENKQAVLLESSQRLGARVREQLAELPPESFVSAQDFFRALCEAHSTAQADAPELRQEIWRTAAQQPPVSEGHPHIEGIARLVAVAQARGLIRSDVAATALARVFLTSLLGFLSRDRAADDPDLLLLVEIYGAGTAPTG